MGESYGAASAPHNKERPRERAERLSAECSPGEMGSGYRGDDTARPADERTTEAARASPVDAQPKEKSAEIADSPFVRLGVYIICVGKRWATVTVTDSEGRRHSVDVYACSTYDAAHMFVAHAKTIPQSGLPPLREGTVFEVIAGGEIHYIKGSALQRWILRERQERKGPAGFLFSQRPTLE